MNQMEIGRGDTTEPQGTATGADNTTFLQQPAPTAPVSAPGGARAPGRVYSATPEQRPGGAPAGPATPRKPPATAAPSRTAAPVARGRTTIAEDVVEQVIERIVDLAAGEVAGVQALHPDVAAFLSTPAGEGAGGAAPSDADESGAAGEPAEADDVSGSGEAGRAVVVRQDGDNVEINLAIVVEFGHAVHEVVEQVRAHVISSTERLLGLTVTGVNVVVAAVSFPPEGGS